MLFALYALFFLSGAAGLIYESIWTRYLALLVGHSAYAQILVLTIFLGGMAVGSFVVGRYSERIRRPLIWYAIVEVAVGVLGLLFHPVFRAVSAAAYDSLFPALIASPGAQSAVKWLLAASLILPQSILLGATFPLISAGILRRWKSHPGSVLSWLYASNSFGAAVGVLLAGFYLVSHFDFPGTLAIAAGLNFFAAAIVVVLVRQRKESFVAPIAPTSASVGRVESSAPAPTINTRWLLLGAAFGTAVASFVYEIAWIRMLSLVLGSATHSFELMLSTFILGLALGALAVSTRADRWRDPLRALALVQCAMGALAVATLPLYIASFSWISTLIGVFPKTSSGYAGFTIARYAICLAVMLPATFCAGMTLPLITRILYGANREAAIGEVYAANTAGSIVGVQLAGLVLLPVLGLKFLLISGAALDVAIGLMLMYVALPRLSPSRTRTLGAIAAASIVVFLAASSVRFDRSLLSSGVYRFGGIPSPGEFATTFYKDGRTATVTVKREGDGNLILSTNGKPDASVPPDWLAARAVSKTRRPLQDDVSTQVLLPLIAMAHAPHARTAAVIGQGSGMTSHMLLASPTLRELATIEIEPEMIRASTQFRPVNHRVFSDARSHFVVDDARSYFAGAGHRFDLIVSEPSNPWVSGVAGLFTTEFYARIKGYLAPGGVFAQWMHLYEMNDSLVLTMLAAVQQNFPAYDVYLTDDTDIVIIASTDSTSAPDWRVTEWPMVAEGLKSVTGLTPQSLAALHLADSRALSPLVATVRPNSDFAPALDLGAEKARYLLTEATGFEKLNASSFDIAAALSGRPMPPTSDAEMLANIWRLQIRARSARLRLSPSDTTGPGEGYAAVVQRRRSFDSLISGSTPPSDWLGWVTTLFTVDRDIQGGSPGYVDTELYRRVEAFVSRVNAPAGIRETVQFREAADGWDFEVVQRVGDELIGKMLKGEKWFSPDYLRDATVTAHLMNGDPRGANAAFRALLPLVSRDPVVELRTRLLGAAINHRVVLGAPALHISRDSHR